MQLKIQRSQRTGGFTGSTVFFCLDVRAEYAPEEQDNVRKYKLGGQLVYASKGAQKHYDKARTHAARGDSDSFKDMASGTAGMLFSLALARLNLNITIASLGRGHHVECKDLAELIEAENTVREACRAVTRFLAAAATFDGSETVIEYHEGEELEHVAQNAPPLIACEPEVPDSPPEPALSTPVPPPTPPKTLSSPPSSAQMNEGGIGANQSSIQAGGALKHQWLLVEKAILAYTASKGWNVTEMQVRWTCGAAGFLIFILIARTF